MLFICVRPPWLILSARLLSLGLLVSERALSLLVFSKHTPSALASAFLVRYITQSVSDPISKLLQIPPALLGQAKSTANTTILCPGTVSRISLLTIISSSTQSSQAIFMAPVLQLCAESRNRVSVVFLTLRPRYTLTLLFSFSSLMLSSSGSPSDKTNRTLSCVPLHLPAQPHLTARSSPGPRYRNRVFPAQAPRHSS